MSHSSDFIPYSPAIALPATSETMDHPVAAANADTIYLEVGQATYSIKRETLAKFEFFRKLMLEPPCSNMFNIDANQEVFPYIIAYLRRGTYPLVMDKKGRHDIPAYLALLEEAKYFQLERLAEWLETGRYAEAARTECTTTIRLVSNRIVVSHVESMAAAITPDGKVVSTVAEACFPAWGKKLVYRCPREKHNGNRAECGKKCHNALGGEPGNYDEVPTLRLLEVKTHLVVDPRLCRDEEW